MREQNTRLVGSRNGRLLGRHPYFDGVLDLDQTREMVAAKYCSHEMTLVERAPMDAWMNVVEGRNVLYSSVGYGAASVVKPGATESFVPIMVPLSGGGTVEVGHEHVDISTETAAVVSASEPLRMQLSHDCTLLIVCIKSDTIESHVSDMIGDALSAPLRFTPGMDLTKGRAALWSRQLMDDVADLDSPDSLILAAEPLAHYAEERLITSLLLTQPHNYSERIPVEPAHGIPAQQARVGKEFIETSGAPEPVGALIERARQQGGLSQYALADLLVDLSGNDSVSRDNVARWERGKRIPGPYWRNWLGVALGLPPDQISAAARSARRRRRSVSDRAQGETCSAP